MRGNPFMDDEHVDAACAWLNLEAGVLAEIAERDFGIDEVELTVSTHESTRQFLVDRFGEEEGTSIFEHFRGGDDLIGLSDAELAAELRQRFAEASLEMAFYMLSSRWSVQNRMREEGATEEAFMRAWDETGARLEAMVGRKQAERAAQLAHEFNASVTGQPV